MERRQPTRRPARHGITMRDRKNAKAKNDERKPDRPDKDRGPKGQAGNGKDKQKDKVKDKGQPQTDDGQAGKTPQVGAAATPAGGKVEAFLACLRRSIGGRYCLPANEPHCTDCSGLVRRCYLEATGKDVGGDSHEQIKLGTAVSRADVRPGDLLFWDTMGGSEVRGGNPASHVGVASGGNRMINALNEELGIRDSDLGSDYWTNQVVFLGARRLEF